MMFARGAVSRKWIAILVLVVIVLVGAIYLIERFIYVGPGLPQRDYLADYTQHGLRTSGKSIAEARAARDKLLKIEQLLQSEIKPTMDAADAYFGMLGTEAELKDTWPKTEPIVLASLRRAEELGVRRATDELIDIGVFIDPNIIHVEGRDQKAPPHIATLRGLARMESDFLVLAARAGDAEGVVEAYTRIAGLADVAASSGGGILVHLIAIGLRSYAIDTLMDVVCEREHEREFLDAVRALLAIDGHDRWPDVSVVLEAELIGSRHLTSDLGNPPWKMINPAHQLGVVAENHEAALNLWRTHPEGQVAGLRAFRDLSSNSSRMNLLADLVMPSTERYFAALMQFELTRNAERAVLAIEHHRATMGELPASLEALVPGDLAEVPSDPFSRQPLVYAIDPDLPNGYRLYARGVDGQDNGGANERGRESQATSLDETGVDYPIVPRPE